MSNSDDDLLSQALLPSTEPPHLGVGAEVLSKSGEKKPLSVAQVRAKRAGKKVRQSRSDLRGVIVKSAPARSWIVYWYSIEKTSVVKYNQLRSVANPSPQAQKYVSELSGLSDEQVDFSTEKDLRHYIDVRQNDLAYEDSGGKIPAKPDSTVVTPLKTPATAKRAAESPQASEDPSSKKSKTDESADTNGE